MIPTLRRSCVPWSARRAPRHGVVAEGVETVEQLEIVKREGCTEVQGFLFSRPLPAAEARAFAERHDVRAMA